ncbi:MAG: PDZ domain-containing protein [Nitrospinales bacterium]
MDESLNRKPESQFSFFHFLFAQVLVAFFIMMMANVVDANELSKYSFKNQNKSHSLQYQDLFGMPASKKIAIPDNNGWLGILLKEAEPIINLDEIKIKFQSSSVIPTLEVIGVFPHSPAANSGLLVGDKILAVDDELISDSTPYSLIEKFTRQISTRPIGKKICLHILRNQKMRNIFVPVLSRPKAKVFQKAHPELERDSEKNMESFLFQVLKSENLLDEYNRTASEILNRASDVISFSLDEKKFNPFRLEEVNYLLHNPMKSPLVAELMVSTLEKQFNSNHSSFVGLLNEAMEGLDFEIFKVEPIKESVLKGPEIINLILSILEEASKVRSEALSQLTGKDIETLYQSFSTIGFNEFAKKDLKQILNLALKVDLSKLMQASIGVAEELDNQLANLPDSLLEYKFPVNWDVVNEDNLIRIQTPHGIIFLGGKGDNIYREDALLLVDLGGDDIYLNNAGASTEKLPFSVLVDFSGNDLYKSSKNVSQGSGFLGGGFLIDYAGNDRYIANTYSQGSGFLGVGLLADFDGHDEYSCSGHCQASGIFGIGLLAEANGDDKYFADIFSQGVALTKGYGALIEAGGDDDYYAGGIYPDHRQPEKAFLSMSQGFGYGIRPNGVEAGASGGIGILIDQSGNDIYVGDYFGQGSSYWYALGILSDQNGNDKYFAGRYSQGAGIHHSAGILSDVDGDDEYLVHYGVSQGCGHDLAIGFLLDYAGDDKYTGGIISQGVGNGNGIGIFNDNGGSDEYSFIEPGQGSGHFLPFRSLGSIGVFIDTGGDVDFYKNEEKNNRTIFKNHWGIFADTK